MALILEYEGTNYQGFQVQPNTPTIQGTLEEALRRVLGGEIITHGAGRTDSGVHALGQVVTFFVPDPARVDRLQGALNFHLPPDIRVRAVYQVAPEFDPRRHALSREYQYLIWNAPAPSALWRRFVHHVPQPLDVEAMGEAAQVLVGEHDYSGFLSDSEAARCRGVRRMFKAEVTKRPPLVIITLKANAFLPHQVRRTAGALLHVGLGKQEVGQFRQWVLGREKGLAVWSLPAPGLFLVEVRYLDFPLASGVEKITASRLIGSFL
ncbi:MAG: tRNA pseudouridine(38-40) synthase TruA [Chloroflexi bacterium]|nr:tRNA pseudouridine(38-40) synthase TruA [Chloroflexota bacterium]